MAPKVLNDHNGGVSESTFFHHMRQKNDLDSRKAKLAGDTKNWKKQAKDDGIDLGDLEHALKIGKLSIEEQIASHNRRVAYLRFMKRPIGEQISFIDETVPDETGLTDEQREKKWTDIGFVAGAEGKNMADVMSGHDPNSETGRWITAGWEKGQADISKGIKKGPAKQDKADEKANDVDAGKTKPKHEPEVEEAKKRGRPKKTDGVSYYHNPETRKVFEIKVSDAVPEGAVSITKPEYEKLAAEYAAAEKAEWEEAQKAKAADEPPSSGDEPPSSEDDSGSDDGWGEPPTAAKN